jgi:hypothetical protein
MCNIFQISSGAGSFQSFLRYGHSLCRHPCAVEDAHVDEGQIAPSVYLLIRLAPGTLQFHFNQVQLCPCTDSFTHLDYLRRHIQNLHVHQRLRQ